MASHDNMVSLPRGVIKRDGASVPFDSDKIRFAITRAGQASGEFDASEAALPPPRW